MNREIKFRGKTRGGKWLYGDLIHRDNRIYIVPEDGLDSFDNYEIVPETVGQYIGLKDKNSKEIYRGDIVTAWSEGSCGNFEIRWRMDGGGTPCLLLYPAWQSQKTWSISATRETDGQVYDRGLEIIGNIHDNPSLLEPRNRL